MRADTAKRRKKLNEINTGDKVADLWQVLRRTTHVVLKAREKELLPLGISAVQSAVLVLVQAADENITPIELSRQLLRDAHSVSELLTRMEKDGLVKRVHDLPRKNQVRVTLTEKGLEILSRSTKRKAIHTVFSVLTVSERRELYASLTKLRSKALELIKGKPWIR